MKCRYPTPTTCSLLKDLQHDDADAPEDLTDQVADLLEEEPELSWDVALKRIVDEATEDDGGGVP